MRRPQARRPGRAQGVLTDDQLAAWRQAVSNWPISNLHAPFAAPPSSLPPPWGGATDTARPSTAGAAKSVDKEVARGGQTVIARPLTPPDVPWNSLAGVAGAAGSAAGPAVAAALPFDGPLRAFLFGQRVAFLQY